MDTNTTQNNNAFDVNIQNQMTGQTGVIPAESITTNPRVNIPEVNLESSAPVAQQVVNEASSRFSSSPELERLRGEREIARADQRVGEIALVNELKGQSQEIRDLARQNETIIDPIQRDIDDLNETIRQRTTQLRTQILDERGRIIPQAFITGRTAILQQRMSAELADLGALLDAKNGQLQNAYRKIDMSMQIMREVNAVELREKEVGLQILKDLTGEAKEEEQKEVDRLKEEQKKFEAKQEQLKQLVIQNAGLIPSKVAQNALLDSDPDNALNSIMPYLGTMQRMELAIKNAQLRKLNSEIVAQNALQNSGEVVDAGTAQERANFLNALQDLAQDSSSKKRVFGNTRVNKLMPTFVDNLATRAVSRIIPGTKEKDFINKVDNVVDTLTLDNMGKIKGTLSDSDMAILRNASSKMKLSGSQEAFDEAVQEALTLAYSKFGMINTTDMSDDELLGGLDGQLSFH